MLPFKCPGFSSRWNPEDESAPVDQIKKALSKSVHESSSSRSYYPWNWSSLISNTVFDCIARYFYIQKNSADTVAWNAIGL